MIKYQIEILRLRLRMIVVNWYWKRFFKGQKIWRG